MTKIKCIKQKIYRLFNIKIFEAIENIEEISGEGSSDPIFFTQLSNKDDEVQ